MKHTRNKYHQAVRKAKRLHDRAKTEALLLAADEGNAELFKEMKKSLTGKSSGQEVPDCLEGKVSHEDIVGKFRECYSALYNANDRSEEMENLNSVIADKIRENCEDSLSEASRITADVVKKAAANMKPNKSDVSGSYTSDIFLHGPDILFDHLAKIFQSCVIHGTMTKEILACAFLPLFKGGLKNPEKFDSRL